MSPISSQLAFVSDCVFVLDCVGLIRCYHHLRVSFSGEVAQCHYKQKLKVAYYSAVTTNASEFKKSFSWNNIRCRMIATARGVRGKWRRHNKCPVLLDNWQALLNYSRRELQVLFSSNRSILRAWAQILERPAFARVLNLMRQHSEISARLDSFVLLELDTGL